MTFCTVFYGQKWITLICADDENYNQVHVRNFFFGGGQTVSLVSKAPYHPPPKYFQELLIQTVTAYLDFSSQKPVLLLKHFAVY